MKRRIWPIGYASDITMFYWIVMNIVCMSNEIGFVSNFMFPKSALPNATLMFALVASGNPFTFFNMPTKMRFDLSPSATKIIVGFR